MGKGRKSYQKGIFFSVYKRVLNNKVLLPFHLVLFRFQPQLTAPQKRENPLSNFLFKLIFYGRRLKDQQQYQLFPVWDLL